MHDAICPAPRLLAVNLPQTSEAMTDFPLSRRAVSAQRVPAPRAWPRLNGRVFVGLLVALAVWLAVVALSEPFGRWWWGTAQDARSYWLPTLADPYANAHWTTPSAYVYSPAFLQLVAPLALLPWQAFVAAWTGILIGALRFLTGPRLLALGVVLAIPELSGGNISLLLAVAIVAGFRWPAAWAFVLLTKVTPGVGLLWFALRGEWRSLAIAVGATFSIFLGSAIFMPGAWTEWLAVLAEAAGREGTWAALPVPFLVRLPVAVVVVAWGAQTNRRWTVPVAAMIALPALWYGGLSMLLAVIALRDDRRDDQSSAGSPAEASPSRRQGVVEPTAAGA
jgi:glycosyl transferase family 87